MSTQRTTVTPHQAASVLTWISAIEIAIAEIQRPFVWDANTFGIARKLKKRRLAPAFIMDK